MPPALCRTCAELLFDLSRASERLFSVSSELSSAAVAWSVDAGAPPSEALMLRTRTLRAECTRIRARLEEHRARQHGGNVAA